MPFALRCPDCRKTFPWQAGEDFPRYCPLCRADMGENKAAEGEVVMPFIRHRSTDAADQVYRQMEAGSEQRATLAAEMTGAPVSEMAGLKITDLNSTRHQGDVAAAAVASNLAGLGMKSLDDGFKGADGLSFAAGVQSGPMPNAGAKMRTVLQNRHAEVTGGMGVSDRPALETTQPGYRRRG